MYFKFAFCPIILLLSASLSFAQNVNVVIHGAASIAKTDDNFVCATLDWWPAETCEYNQCPWGNAGILNLDLRYGALINAIKAFNPLRIKVGGSLQDNVVYKVGEVSSCPNFMKEEDGLFGFSQGCLSMERWDQLNRFFNHTGVKLTFGLNALFGRNESQTEKGLWIGDWQSQNTRDFMQHTISKGYKVNSYEFGNQLSGSGMGAKVDAKQYGNDVIVLKNLVKELYAHPETEPKGIVDGLTHHIYNLGPGDDPNMMNKVLNPSYLNQVSQTYKGVSDVVNKFRPQLGAWVSESGGALKGGSKDVSRTFADGFW
ncbi:glucuronidase 1 [Hibiscus trionum]|uniref:Glucuronidase 1 n=1 Tax=Hibiscus trionum TaxID=183268 RepID=A0A9W7GR24_HIBTR|nr:glucuronidase 1 [Hibiscus trionum]